MRWNTVAGHWQEMFDDAKKYYELNGNVKVPPAYKTSNGYDPSLWLDNLKRIQDHLSI